MMVTRGSLYSFAVRADSVFEFATCVRCWSSRQTEMDHAQTSVRWLNVIWNASAQS